MANPPSASESPVCNLCDRVRAADAEQALVRCNVRRFRDEQFEVWRCAGCGSIHAAQEVDLDHYYAGYPVHAGELNWMLEITYGNLLKRLVRSGLRKEHRILDYGCGMGLLVQYLRKRGYEQVVGYDPYGKAYADASVLSDRYDCVVSQDVIEHVPDPRELLRQFSELTRPDGIVAVGTPDASAIDLSAPEDYVHVLHQPYHRHILSHEVLCSSAEALGLRLDRYYDTMYNNTLFPSMNPRFVLHYVRAHDDCFDLVVEPPRMSLKLCGPATPFFMLFGYFFDRHTDIMAVFRKETDSPGP